MNFSFMDQDFEAIYKAEQRAGAVSIVFTSLALIIYACTGACFGLAAYAAEQRHQRDRHPQEFWARQCIGHYHHAFV